MTSIVTPVADQLLHEDVLPMLLSGPGDDEAGGERADDLENLDDDEFDDDEFDDDEFDDDEDEDWEDEDWEDEEEDIE